jgi:hypothetical protein
VLARIRMAEAIMSQGVAARGYCVLCDIYF